MESGCGFPKESLAQLRHICCDAPGLAALYLVEPEQTGYCNLAALFAEAPAWEERLDLELAVARALGTEGVEVLDLRRLPLVTRFRVVNQAELVYVGHPDLLAQFIEETLGRYSAFYPLLEALYWKAETGSGSEEKT